LCASCTSKKTNTNKSHKSEVNNRSRSTTTDTKDGKSSAVAEMGDRLATIGMGRKWRGAAVGG